MFENPFHYLSFVKAPVFVLERSPNDGWQFVFLNEACTNILGPAASDLVGKSAQDIFSACSVNGKLIDIDACVALEKPAPFAFKPVNDACMQGFTTHLHPEFDTEGRVSCVIGTWLANETSGSVEKTYAFEEQQHEQLEEFITLAAHDLRTPMRNVKLLIEMLRDDFADHGDGKLELMDMIEDVALKSNTLVNEVLDYSQTTHTGPSSEGFNLASVCVDLKTILDPQDQQTITWSNEMLYTDKKVVQVVLRNLIDNSLKHAKASDLVIGVSVRATSSDALQFSVEDNGKGLLHPNLVFSETHGKRKSSGYGLLGIKRLVSARGGEITATLGGDGLGLHISFSLPGSILSSTLGAAEQNLTEPASRTLS